MKRVERSILSLVLLAAAGCGGGGALPSLDVPWRATPQARGAAYQEMGWTAPADGTLYLVDRTDNGRLLGAFEMKADEVFTFTPRLGRAHIEDRLVELRQRPKFGHEHEILFLRR
jgi:hypothetical protein